MKKTVGILAHVDAGKTTLSERILFSSNTIRTMGNVDRKNTVLDFENVEKERGITVFSAVSPFSHGNDDYFLIDTPGHTDFSTQTERAVEVLDAAIITVCAVEGIKAHTKTLEELTRKHNIPVFFFINKADRDIADPQKVLADLKKTFGKECLDFTSPLAEENKEIIAENSDSLLEKYLSDTATEKDFEDEIRRTVKERKLFPVYTGSALTGDGVDELLSGLDKYLTTDYNENNPFKARIFKVSNGGERLCYAKVLEGKVLPRTEIGVNDKIATIKTCTGAKLSDLKEAKAGDVVILTGLKEVKIGDIISKDGITYSEIGKDILPVMKAGAVFTDCTDIHTGFGYFKTLEDEEPTLEAGIQKDEISVKIMGQVQTEILTRLMKERFNADVSFKPPKIIYKETVKSPVLGIGHYEPLRHYAEVILRISPAKRGRGITFESLISTDMLDRDKQRLIKTHVFEKSHKGVLTASDLTDVKIELLAGKDHLKHTEGGDFRQSVYRAIRQGLRKAENVLLEPIYAFTINVPTDYLGRVMSDLEAMSAEYSSPEAKEDRVEIKGTCPVSEMDGYSQTLTIYSKGRGTLNLRAAGYRECHNAEKVIEETAYNPDEDEENPCGSVFCAKGAGFYVPYNEVENYSHLLPSLK